MRIKADVNLCTGCRICSLACSFEMNKSFNPRQAKIYVNQELIGVPKRIEFLNQCNVRIPDTCSEPDMEPLCIAYCCFGALQFDKGEKDELHTISPSTARNW